MSIINRATVINYAHGFIQEFFDYDGRRLEDRGLGARAFDNVACVFSSSATQMTAPEGWSAHQQAAGDGC